MKYGGNTRRQNVHTMIVEIESYKWDILLYGKQITYAEFLRQIDAIEAVYDRIQDNFINLLCRRYGWTITEAQENPAYVYDRDIERAYRITGETFERGPFSND